MVVVVKFEVRVNEAFRLGLRPERPAQSCSKYRVGFLYISIVVMLVKRQQLMLVRMIFKEKIVLESSL